MCCLCIAMPKGNRRISAVMQIRRALEGMPVRHVLVIPVRMTEAWLLIDELALRRAAGNPNGRNPLDLPALKDLEALPEPADYAPLDALPAFRSLQNDILAAVRAGLE